MRTPMYEEPEVHPEIPLHGGNVGQIFRVGDTVRRSAGPWTPAVHQLLHYLEMEGFAGAPRALGIDAKGREVLTYLDGDVYQYPMPDFVWSEETLVAVAQLMHTYHDVVRGFSPPADATWQVQAGAPATGPIVCHNDIAPYNTVFRDQVPVGFIDWDLASPGPALYDVAHAVWYWVPLYDAPEKPMSGHGRRLRLFCDAYGMASSERQRLLSEVRLREEVSYRTIREWGEAGKPGWEQMWRTGHAEGKLDSLRWLEDHWAALHAALVA